MASVMGINKIGLPKLSENMDPEDARALRSYLYQMQEQLQYVLSNLDVENMSDEMRTKLQNLQTVTGLPYIGLREDHRANGLTPLVRGNRVGVAAKWSMRKKRTPVLVQTRFGRRGRAPEIKGRELKPSPDNRVQRRCPRLLSVPGKA